MGDMFIATMIPAHSHIIWLIHYVHSLYIGISCRHRCHDVFFILHACLTPWLSGGSQWGRLHQLYARNLGCSWEISDGPGDRYMEDPWLHLWLVYTSIVSPIQEMIKNLEILQVCVSSPEGSASIHPQWPIGCLWYNSTSLSGCYYWFWPQLCTAPGFSTSKSHDADWNRPYEIGCLGFDAKWSHRRDGQKYLQEIRQMIHSPG